MGRLRERPASLLSGADAAASVLGVPAGTLIGTFAGWRIAFAALAALSFAVLVALGVVLPALPADRPVEVRQLAGQVPNKSVRLGILVTLFVVTGQFAAYTFVSPALQSIAGISGNFVGHCSSAMASPAFSAISSQAHLPPEVRRERC